MNVVPGKEAINRYITFLTVSCWSRCQSVTLLYLCTPLSATLCSITLYKLNNYHTQRHLVFPATTLPSFRSGRGKIERSARRLMKLLTISPSDSSIGGMGLGVRSPRKSLKRHLMRRHRHPCRPTAWRVLRPASRQSHCNRISYHNETASELSGALAQPL